MNFVFLQGMPSPFFTRIARGLSSRGARVSAINLCAGDWLFWRGGTAVNYRGSLAQWPDYFRKYCERHGVTDLVLLGEQRRYHKEAIVVAQALGVRVNVTDFGYLRPDWITLERDGMGGNSRFPRDPGELESLVQGEAEPNLSECYRDSALNMALGDLLYSFSTVLSRPFFPHYQRSDHRPHPVKYFPAMGMTLLRMRLKRTQILGQLARVVQGKDRFFVFPLQLEHDFQIVSYSPFSSVDEALGEVMASFARHAAASDRLVIKRHPWDPGFRDWGQRVQHWARCYGIEGRVDYLEGGNLDRLIEVAAGMVTVNSTSGVRALQLGCPVLVLGQAIYDSPGLTAQSGLDEFWHSPPVPLAARVSLFVRALVATIQIRGVFFNEPGLSVSVEAAVERLWYGRVGQSPVIPQPRR